MGFNVMLYVFHLTVNDVKCSVQFSAELLESKNTEYLISSETFLQQTLKIEY